MNKDELIKLKERLVQERLSNESKNKRYCYFDAWMYSEREGDKIETVDEISSKINTPIAIEKIESLLVNFVEYLTSKGEDFQKIVISMSNDVFVSEDFLNRLNTYGNDVNLSKEDILWNIIPSSIFFSVYRNGNRDSVFSVNNETLGGEHFLGVINYNEFVEGISLLGYDISLQNFDEYVDDICKKSPVGPKIVIDFSKEKEHKH